MRWSPDEDDRLLAFARQGLTAQAIGRHLHRSKNAVIGRLNRLGFPLSMPSARPSLRRATGPARQSAPPPKVRSAPDFCAAGGPSSLDIVERAVTALRAGDCRWPIGDPLSLQFRFCGAPAKLRNGAPSSYCDTHAAIAYRPLIRRSLRRQEVA